MATSTNLAIIRACSWATDVSYLASSAARPGRPGGLPPATAKSQLSSFPGTSPQTPVLASLVGIQSLMYEEIELRLLPLSRCILRTSNSQIIYPRRNRATDSSMQEAQGLSPVPNVTGGRQTGSADKTGFLSRGEPRRREQLTTLTTVSSETTVTAETKTRRLMAGYRRSTVVPTPPLLEPGL